MISRYARGYVRLIPQSDCIRRTGEGRIREPVTFDMNGRKIFASIMIREKERVCLVFIEVLIDDVLDDKFEFSEGMGVIMIWPFVIIRVYEVIT